MFRTVDVCFENAEKVRKISFTRMNFRLDDLADCPLVILDFLSTDMIVAFVRIPAASRAGSEYFLNLLFD